MQSQYETRGQTPSKLQIKRAKSITHFQTKTPQETYPLVLHIPSYIAYLGEHTPSGLVFDEETTGMLVH